MVIFRTQFVSAYRMVRFSDARSYKIGPVFERSTSLDHFINERVTKNILSMTKWSSSYHSKTGQVFEWFKTRQNSCHFVLAIRKPDKYVRFSNGLAILSKPWLKQDGCHFMAKTRQNSRHFVLAIRNPDRTFLTASLDFFIIKGHKKCFIHDKTVLF